jgi:hypothetical protein
LIEFVIAFFCLFGRQITLNAVLVAWVASNLAVYRFGLWWIGYHKPCNCLGNLTDALHISARVADTGMKIVLGYLLIGSLAILFWLWRQRRRALAPIPSVKSNVSEL